MAITLKSILGTIGSVAPTIATALGGPLAGTAVGALSNALFGTPDKTEQEVAAEISKATPEQLMAMKKADQEFEIKMKEMDIDLTKSYIADTSDARHTFGANNRVFWLGMSILITFTIIIGLVLYGCYRITTGTFQVKDAGIFATATGLVGTITGYVAGNAQQVVGYFFGSSAGSAEKTNAMSQAINQIAKK